MVRREQTDPAALKINTSLHSSSTRSPTNHISLTAKLYSILDFQAFALSHSSHSLFPTTFEPIVNLPFFLARRYLLRQKGTFSSFIIRLAMISTALSVAVMLLAVAFITGFKYEIREKLFSFWGHVLITPFNVNANTIVSPVPIEYDTALAAHIRKLPHVTQVAPWAARPAILQANGTMEGIKLKGVAESFRLSPRISLTGQKINYSDTSYSKEILLSRTTANRLRLKAGDYLQLYFLEPGATTPRIRKVKLAGVFHTGMDEIDKDYGICDLRLLQRINSWAPTEINGYQIDLSAEEFADSVSSHIFYNLLEAPLTANTMREIYINIFDWLQLQDLNAQIVLAIMAIVAIINLAVALLILIVEQARMVGVLKSLGMGNRKLQQIFLYYAGMIALSGIIIGNLVGVGIAVLQQQTQFIALNESVYYMQYVPVRLTLWQVLAIDAATLLICLLIMLLPTLFVRRINVAKVIQFK